MSNLFEEARKDAQAEIAKLSDRQKALMHTWHTLGGIILLWFIPGVFQIDIWNALLVNKEMLAEFNTLFISTFVLILLSSISYENGLELGSFTLRTAYLIWACCFALMFSSHIGASQLVILGFVIIFKRAWMLVSFIFTIWWMIVFYTINRSLSDNPVLAFICGVLEGFAAMLIMNGLISIISTKKRRLENKQLNEE